MVQGQKGNVYTYILSTGTLLETSRAMFFFFNLTTKSTESFNI